MMRVFESSNNSSLHANRRTDCDCVSFGAFERSIRFRLPCMADANKVNQ
jgi:hypothetical protein